MSVDIANALSAYGKAVGKTGLDGLQPRDQGGGAEFGQLVRDATEKAIGTLAEGEKQSLMAAAGKADLTDVVTAVSQAEITLQTVVTLRDRVVQAYQDILRMPI